MPSTANAPDLKTSWLYCLLVQVRDDTAADIRRNAEQVMAICQRRGVIMDVMASVQFVVFGIPEDALEQCEAMVERRLQNCGRRWVVMFGPSLSLVTLRMGLLEPNTGWLTRLW